LALSTVTVCARCFIGIIVELVGHCHAKRSKACWHITYPPPFALNKKGLNFLPFSAVAAIAKVESSNGGGSAELSIMLLKAIERAASPLNHENLLTVSISLDNRYIS